MRESYRKGVANHPGPEPCEGSREAALEARRFLLRHSQCLHGRWGKRRALWVGVWPLSIANKRLANCCGSARRSWRPTHVRYFGSRRPLTSTLSPTLVEAISYCFTQAQLPLQAQFLMSSPCPLFQPVL
jgi:hypothetical protein